MSFVISTDTSANLPTAELQWHQLHLLPFSYIVDDVEHQCLDLTAFDGDAYYEMLRHTPATTSMISSAVAWAMSSHSWGCPLRLQKTLNHFR